MSSLIEHEEKIEELIDIFRDYYFIDLNTEIEVLPNTDLPNNDSVNKDKITDTISAPQICYKQSPTDNKSNELGSSIEEATTEIEKIFEKVVNIIEKRFPKSDLLIKDSSLLDYLVMDTYLNLKQPIKPTEKTTNSSLSKILNNRGSIFQKKRYKLKYLRKIPELEKLVKITQGEAEAKIKTNKLSTNTKDKSVFKKTGVNNSLEHYILRCDSIDILMFLIDSAINNPYYPKEKDVENCNFCSPKIKGQCNSPYYCIAKNTIPNTKKFLNKYREYNDNLKGSTSDLATKAAYSYYLKRVFDTENLMYIGERMIASSLPETHKSQARKILSLLILIQNPYNKFRCIDNLFDILESENIYRFDYKQQLIDKWSFGALGKERVTKEEIFFKNVTSCRELLMYSATTLYPVITAAFYVSVNIALKNKNILEYCERYIVKNIDRYINKDDLTIFIANQKILDNKKSAKYYTKQKNELENLMNSLLKCSLNSNKHKAAKSEQHSTISKMKDIVKKLTEETDEIELCISECNEIHLKNKEFFKKYSIQKSDVEMRQIISETNSVLKRVEIKLEYSKKEENRFSFINSHTEDIIREINLLQNIIASNIYNKHKYNEVCRLVTLTSKLEPYFMAEYLNIVTKRKTFKFDGEFPENPTGAFEDYPISINEIIDPFQQSKNPL